MTMTKEIVKAKGCQECRERPAEVFRQVGGQFCYKCDHDVQTRLAELRAMVNRCRSGGRP